MLNLTHLDDKLKRIEHLDDKLKDVGHCFYQQVFKETKEWTKHEDNY
jgi:hypothetical protein